MVGPRGASTLSHDFPIFGSLLASIIWWLELNIQCKKLARYRMYLFNSSQKIYRTLKNCKTRVSLEIMLPQIILGRISDHSSLRVFLTGHSFLSNALPPTFQESARKVVWRQQVQGVERPFVCWKVLHLWSGASKATIWRFQPFDGVVGCVRECTVHMRLQPPSFRSSISISFKKEGTHDELLWSHLWHSLRSV